MTDHENVRIARMGEYLRKILSGRIFADDWQPISRYAAATWAFFYAGFLIYAFIGLLQYDTKIAAVVSLLGWCGMLGTVAWLVSRYFRDAAVQQSETNNGTLS